jgi:organic hydroperoxide reductase OsmC/OhrA
MSDHHAIVSWERHGARFADNRYSRAHEWHFDGGARVSASSSPHSVPVPYSDPAAVDPEEAYVAALSSCHMLWFLSIAAKSGFAVESYRDAAVGTMEKDASGRMAITTVTLRPHVVFGTEQREKPSDAVVHALHESAHHECYLASSVRSRILIEGTWEA